MRQELIEIDELYKQVEDWIMPLSTQEYLERHGHLGIDEFNRQAKEASEIYNVAIEKFRQLATKLTPSEVIEAFQQGSRILRANLTGYMGHHFDPVYIPVIKSALQADYDYQGAYIWIGILVKNLHVEDVTLYLLEALNSNSQRTVDTALGYVETLHIKSALPKVKLLSESSNINIAEIAKHVLASFESQLD